MPVTVTAKIVARSASEGQSCRELVRARGHWRIDSLRVRRANSYGGSEDGAWRIDTPTDRPRVPQPGYERQVEK
jgi:hypothetical protein